MKIIFDPHQIPQTSTSPAQSVSTIRYSDYSRNAGTLPPVVPFPIPTGPQSPEPSGEALPSLMESEKSSD